MGDKPPGNLPTELENPIVKRAFSMISQQIPLETAVQSLQKDAQLQSQPDEELIRVIEEADRYWRNMYEICVRKPGAIEMYAPLMTACCKQRYDGLWELRKALSDEAEKASLTARMGRLLTVNARCALALSESLLLNEKFQQAYEAFGRAEWAARMIPDEGTLRLCEILWARYGQWVTASVARQQAEIQSAHAGIGELLLGAGPQAEECLRKVEGLFSRHRWVLGERERLRRELVEQPAQAVAPPAERSSVIDSLLTRVAALSAEVQSGRMTMESAKSQARTEFPSLGLQPGMLSTAASMYETLVETDPERAAVLEEINCELALQFENEPDTQALCLGSLGFALNGLARSKGAGFERAIEVLERAYGILSADEDSAKNRRAAGICIEIAVANRYLRNATKLMKWSQRAVERWEKAPEFPRELGTAYGLRGEARELECALDDALEDHFRALGLFRQARSGLDIRRAFHHIFNLCLRGNRLDEAAAAGDEIVDLAQRTGDLDDIEVTTLPLAMALVRVGRLDAALGFLVRAEPLILEALRKDPKNEKLLLHRFEHFMWGSRLKLALLKENSPLSAEEKRDVSEEAHDDIESARQIALDLHDDGRLAEAWLEHALLQELMGNFAAADQCCRTVDFIQGCPPALRAFSFLLGGRIAARLEKFQEANALLDFGLKTLGENGWEDIRIRYLNTRGGVKEKLGDKAGAIGDYEDAVRRTAGFRNLLAEESRVEISGLSETALDRLFSLTAEESPLQDTKRALYWAEYAKSRALAELLGQSQFTAPQPSIEVAGLYAEEQKLLAEVHAGRANSVAEAGKVSLDQSHAMQEKKERLNEIWNEMAVQYPEYVELRRGAVPSWSEIVQMTAG